MKTTQQFLQRGLSAIDPWLDAVFPIATALICAKQRLTGYSLLVVYLLLRLLQRSDREPWRWILISMLVVNAGIIIEDRDLKPGGPSDYSIVALSFAAGFQRSATHWRGSMAWMAACVVPLLGLSLAAGDKMIQWNSSFTGLTSSFTGFNINRIGFLAGLLSIFSYGLLKKSRNPASRITSAALLIGGLAESFLTQSRAAIAAPIIAISLDQALGISWTKKKAILALVSTGAAAILTLHSWYAITPDSKNAFADANRITTIRCWITNTTNKSSDFILGQGYGKTPSNRCSLGKDAVLMERDKPLSHAHNLYVQLFGETGIVGLAFGVTLSIQAFRKAWKRDVVSNDLPTRPLTTYLLLMAMGTTWHSMLLNQVLVGYSLAALTATDRDPSAAGAAIPGTPPDASAQQG